MKYLISIVLAISLLTSCQENKEKNIGILISSLKIERFNTETTIMCEEISKAGAKCVLRNAENDAALQVKQFDELLKENISVLIMAPVNEQAGKIILDKAHERSVNVIIYDALFDGDIDYLVRFSDYEVGETMANYAVKNVPSGNYVLIGGDGTIKNSHLIKDGTLKVLEPLIKNGSIKIPYSMFIEDWSEENAYMAMKTFVLLQNPEKIDAIIVSNDNMANGVIRALKETNVNSWPLITGQDGSLLARNNIKNGQQAMSIVKDSKLIAQTAATMALECAQNGVPKTNGSTQIADKNGAIKNIPTFFIQLKVVDNKNL